MRNSAQLARYHLKASSALAAELYPDRRDSFTVDGRNPASDALRTLLNLLQEHGYTVRRRRYSSTLYGRLVSRLNTDLIAAVESSIRRRTCASLVSASQPAVLGGDQEGWMEQLEASPVPRFAAQR